MIFGRNYLTATIRILLFAIFAVAILMHEFAHGGTIVGNGDDGSDLENLERISSGILENTRQQASTLLEKMNVKGVQHLGTLSDEVSKADMYLVQQNAPQTKDFDRGLEVSQDGRFVYARTIARPYSATRFFPAALLLSEQQLVRLHIHEALHRALPESVRENESAVSDITLAITEPNASFDSIRTKTIATVDRMQATIMATSAGSPAQGSVSNYLEIEPPPTERLKNPSFFRYSFQAYQNSKTSTFGGIGVPVNSMHRIDSYLHPFGRGPRAIGMGLSFSYLNLPDRSYLGPIQISARFLLATWRQFDVDLWAEQGLYTLSQEELKNLPNSRDTTTLGISMRREAEWFYTENFISYTLPSKSETEFGGTKYTYNYKSLVDVSVSFGARVKKVWLGARGDVLLSNGFETADDKGLWSTPAERIRLVRVGPELGFRMENLVFRAYAQQVIDGTPNYNLDSIANIMGHGAGQGYVGSSLSLQF